MLTRSIKPASQLVLVNGSLLLLAGICVSAVRGGSPRGGSMNRGFSVLRRNRIGESYQGDLCGDVHIYLA